MDIGLFTFLFTGIIGLKQISGILDMKIKAPNFDYDKNSVIIVKFALFGNKFKSGLNMACHKYPMHAHSYHSAQYN